MTAAIIIVTFLFLAIEVLIGLKRGLIQSAFRVILLTIGTVIDAIIASKIAEKIVNAVANSQGKSNIAEVVSGSVSNSDVQGILASSGGVIAGLAMSFATPVLFAVLYLIFKALTWVIYLVVAPIVRKTSLGELLTTKAVWSKVGGAVLGAFIALYSCALVVMPFSGLANALEDGSAQAEKLVSKFAGNTTQIAGISVDKLTDGVGSASEALSSAATILYKITGAQAVSNSIYDSLSKSSPKAAGFDMKTEYISFPELLKEALKLSDDVIDTVDMFGSNKQIDAEMIDKVAVLFNKVLDTDILAGEDKVMLINSVVPMLKGVLKNAVSFTDLSGLIKTYSNYSDMRAGYDNLFSAAKKLLNLSTKLTNTAGSGSGSKGMAEVMSSKENVTDMVESIILLGEASESGSAGDVLKDVVSEFANVEATKILNEEVVDNMADNKEEVVESLVIVGEIMNGKTDEGKLDMTEDELNAKIDQLESYGVVTPEAVDEFRKYVDEHGIESINLEGIDLSNLGL